MNEITSQHMHILQHSIGADEYGQFGHAGMYRNHFVAGGVDVQLCRDLVASGLMQEGKASALSGGSPWFRVTQQGIDYVALNSPKPPPPPKMSKRKRLAKERYARYREYGECFDNFRHFLAWDSEPERSWNGGAK